MSPEQARKLCQQAGAPLPEGMHAGNFEKVANTRRKVLDGISFRSTLEADVYRLLKSWESIGDIINLVCQPRYLLQPRQKIDGKTIRAITYIADFQFMRMINTGPMSGRLLTYVIDAKGHRMEVYKLKSKLFRAKFTHLVFQEWTRETLKANGG